MQRNDKVVLASRPNDRPGPQHFRHEVGEVPSPGDGEMLLETLYLSLDPYMRLRMNDGDSYAEPVAIGEPMCGGTVCRVLISNNPRFQVGDQVLGFSGWQRYAVSDGVGVMKLPKDLGSPSHALGVLGMPGFTAYYGLLHLGSPKPGETVVVGAATGGVGSVVGQIAQIMHCRVVGIAGGEAKCRQAVETLGFDVCIDHSADDFAEQLAAACPDGVDVYFENIGGHVLDAVLPLLNDFARVPLCGVIAWYDGAEGSGAATLSQMMRAMLVKRIRMEGFVILDRYERHFREFVKATSQWIREGRLKVMEDVVDGLENAPAAFLGLLRGDNFGKVVVRVSPE